MVTYNYACPTELYHWGIKGMRWGIRRFQNKDGSLTAEGEKRYGKSDNNALQKKKSTYRLRLEDKYRKTMSPKEAEQKADKRIRTQKILAATAAVTVASAMAYIAGRKYLQKYVDKTLKAGTKFHTVTLDDNKNMKDRFYAAYKPIDRMKYRGMLGQQRVNLIGGKVYDISTKATKDIKIASHKTAEDVFSKLYKKSPEFRDSVKTTFTDKYDGPGLFRSPMQNIVTRKFLNGSSNPTEKKHIKNAFNAFNMALSGEQKDPLAANKFYSELKKRGYSAIYDLNDQKFSGYRANAPVLVFDTASVVKDKVKELKKEGLRYDAIGSDFALRGAEYVAETLGIAGYIHYRRNKKWEAQQQKKQKKNKIKQA